MPTAHENNRLPLWAWMVMIQLLAMLLACAGAGQKSNKQESSSETVEYKHGAKILVQYIADKNETNVFHYIPANYNVARLRLDLTVGGQTIKGKHSFDIFDMVVFEGRKPSKIPTNSAIWIAHGITNRTEWHFPPKTTLTIVIDGNSFNVPLDYQYELTKDDPSDVEFYEVLIATLTYDMYTRIANAKDVIVQIGTASFKFDEEIIASYGDFVSLLAPGGSK